MILFGLKKAAESVLWPQAQWVQYEFIWAAWLEYGELQKAELYGYIELHEAELSSIDAA